MSPCLHSKTHTYTHTPPPPRGVGLPRESDRPHVTRATGINAVPRCPWLSAWRLPRLDCSRAPRGRSAPNPSAARTRGAAADEEEKEEEDAARLGGGVPVAASEPAGAGRAVRDGAHPHVPLHALEYHPHAQPPPPQHPGKRRPRYRTVRGAGGHRLQPGPTLLPLCHVRPHLHSGVPLRPHQAVPLRLPARP